MADAGIVVQHDRVAQSNPRELSRAEWELRRATHRARADAAVGEHLDRARRGIKHPVEDFLFEYYPLRPGVLRRWYPGLGVRLLDVSEDLAELDLSDHRREGTTVWADPSVLAHRREGIEWIHTLLSRSADRAPLLGCFGLHEWAMVHRTSRIRHPQLGLRLSDDEVAGVVEQRGVRCTHYDAYRFFTPTARPLNELVLTRTNQADHDQPGCLHVTMDLYKWAGKLIPLTPSELLLDCFELARDVRWVDMRASPYDLSSLRDPDAGIRTCRPIRIETTPGRSEYVAYQREFAERAAPLRRQLLALVTNILAEPAMQTPPAM